MAQQKEANFINTSLMQLWRCLQGMKQRKGDIPFRESKLTHLLMPYFAKAGLQGVTMMACVNPQAEDYDETISILTNVSIACKIREIVLRPEQFEKKKRSLSSKDAQKAQATGKNKRSSSLISDVTCDSVLHNYHEGTEEELMNLPIVRSMQAEIDKLRVENEELINSQWKRETDIRVEVSEEMAKRSEHLLERIQELQEEINAQSSSQISNVQKSCKKARRQQREEAQMEIARDLEEAEEEMERMKAYYEKEIASLKKCNESLQAEVNNLKVKAAGVTTAPSPIPGVENLFPTATTAEAFSQRMQRDKRFKKGDAATKGKKATKSPTRSPLQTLKDAGNSPLRGKSPVKECLVMEKPEGMSKRKEMPNEDIEEEKSKKGKGIKKAKLGNANDGFLGKQ